ncbi:cytochrome c [Paralimibaculum aggregatum]|uniref:Cytochrome c n=1 Tax=Paralimibaculum aggregatum TaxID=3036245 RepID=A0ABQ6LFP3_9RHOB|nr:cytochrome c [Limibaculum sp. NKW23]GMG82144.1 cytochrome c [Limibaculum sp. NKW23]
MRLSRDVCPRLPLPIPLLLAAALAPSPGAAADPGADDAAALLERGTYLVTSIVACGNCHTPQGPEGPLPGLELAGMENFFETPDFLVHSPNITQDPETGIGAWSDAEIATAIREGRRPDGTIIGPPMPIVQYRNLSDRDVAAIVAYLRTVPPVRREIPASDYRIPLPPAYGPPVVTVAEVPADDPLARGAYLAGPAGHCVECHSPMGENGAPDIEHRLGAGGFEFPGPWGLSVSPDITPTGLADYTDDELRRMITQGVRPDGSAMLPPMPFAYYARMTPEDLDAVILYLRSLPPSAG